MSNFRERLDKIWIICKYSKKQTGKKEREGGLTNATTRQILTSLSPNAILCECFLFLFLWCFTKALWRKHLQSFCLEKFSQRKFIPQWSEFKCNIHKVKTYSLDVFGLQIWQLEGCFTKKNDWLSGEMQMHFLALLVLGWAKFSMRCVTDSRMKISQNRWSSILLAPLELKSTEVFIPERHPWPLLYLCFQTPEHQFRVLRQIRFLPNSWLLVREVALPAA